MKHPLLFLIVLVCLMSCNEKNEYEMEVKRVAPVEKPTTKWKVEGQGFFNAGYQSNPREILIITSPAGKKYLAITGCGVTEIHDEQDGDDTVRRED